MISSQRQHLILSRLRTRGAVRITALSKELGVSAMTIRRDIADLADKGLLKRVHGGAVTTSTLLSEPLFSVKSQMDIGLKDAIAQEAIKYVAPGDVIAIGGGTPAYVFAQHLLESQQSSGITILTNSIPVAELVQALESKDVEVIVTGGVTTRSNSLVGPIADKVVASLRVNTVFLGTHSVSIPRGFLMPNSLVFFTSAGAAQGEIVLAVNTLLMQLFTLFSYIMDGFAYAGEALAGRYIGAKNQTALRNTVHHLFYWGLGLSLIFTILYAIGGKEFLGLLTNDTSVINASDTYFYWALIIPLAGFSAFLWDGVFIGATATRQMLYSMLVASASFFGVYYAFHPLLGNHALWLAFLIYLSLRGVVQTFLGRQIMKKVIASQ